MRQKIQVVKSFTGLSKGGRQYHRLTVLLDGEVGTIFSDIPLENGDYDANLAWTTNKDMGITVKLVSIDD